MKALLDRVRSYIDRELLPFEQDIDRLLRIVELYEQALKFQDKFCECGTVMLTGADGCGYDVSLHEEISKTFEAAEKIAGGE